MRSRSVTLRIPYLLYDAGVELSKKQYRSLNRLFIGLLRYAIATDKDHTFTAAIDKLPIEEQDAIDEQIVAMFRSGGAAKGAWFEKVVKEAVKSIANGEDIPKDRLTRELLRRMGK